MAKSSGKKAKTEPPTRPAPKRLVQRGDEPETESRESNDRAAKMMLRRKRNKTATKPRKRSA